MPSSHSSSSNPANPTASMRGRLKIFLGYASRVGKTFRMLDEARRRKERGEDVIVAAHQPGALAEVRTLLDKLETIPILRTSLGEGLHMDAILRRHPEVCVIDPLANNNPAGFRNGRRWQDIEQLLDAGISILTAINLLYIEEFRERVEAMTGKHTRETVPQDFLARADEIVLVDAPVELLMERRGDETSFSGGLGDPQHTLTTLREMTLVLAAEIVEGQLERYLATHNIPAVRGAHERILVCLTPQSNPSMIASGVRNRDRSHGELHVVHIRQRRLSSSDRARLEESLTAAREAGAEVGILEGEDTVRSLLDYAQRNRITQVFVGHSDQKNWIARLRGSSLDRLLDGAEQMDVRIFPR